MFFVPQPPSRNTLCRTVAPYPPHITSVHPNKKTKVECAAADVRRLQTALDARCAAAPDNEVELAMISADLRRGKTAWRHHMEEILGPQAVPEREADEAPAFAPLPVRNPLSVSQFAGLS